MRICSVKLHVCNYVMKVHKNKKITATTLPFLTRPDLTINVNRSPFGIKFQSTLQLNAMLAKISSVESSEPGLQQRRRPKAAANTVGQKLAMVLEIAASP